MELYSFLFKTTAYTYHGCYLFRNLHALKNDQWHGREHSLACSSTTPGMVL